MVVPAGAGAKLPAKPASVNWPGPSASPSNTNRRCPVEGSTGTRAGSTARQQRDPLVPAKVIRTVLTDGGSVAPVPPPGCCQRARTERLPEPPPDDPPPPQPVLVSTQAARANTVSALPDTCHPCRNGMDRQRPRKLIPPGRGLGCYGRASNEENRLSNVYIERLASLKTPLDLEQTPRKVNPIPQPAVAAIARYGGAATLHLTFAVGLASHDKRSRETMEVAIGTGAAVTPESGTTRQRPAAACRPGGASRSVT